MNQLFVTRLKEAIIAATAVAVSVLPSTAGAVACNVSTLPAQFGVYNPLDAAPTSTTGAINVACTCTGVLDCVAFAYRIEVSAGQSGNTAVREMRSGTGRLQYNLFSDPGFSSIWGTGSAGYSVLYLLTLFGSRQTATVYARIPARQVVSAGSYSDSTVVTISY
ncbi:Csu type fimbrial protein [Croceibacterium ferulae]|uniref:Csu type fimbrial protein n=1 Tax=Croceibacterium ferulae TaxID=1854641 RepID=UPI00138FA55B|nr:spore coat U domain-containing protein [Croceibacterium ferulae]